MSSASSIPEPPTLVRQDDTFYLFVCTWNGIGDGKMVQGAYQHRVYVYQSDDLLNFNNRGEIAILDSHAPGILQGEDGRWYNSSAAYSIFGIDVDRKHALKWLFPQEIAIFHNSEEVYEYSENALAALHPKS